MKEKWNVLLIDDELEFHQLFRAAFPEVELFSTYSIRGGSWLIEQSLIPFDLIILDLNLHEDSQAFEKLKRISRLTFIPIIVVSTYADHNARFEVQKRGASDFLSKGNFDLNNWLGILKKVLAGAVGQQPRVVLTFAEEDQSFIEYLGDKLMENKVNVVLCQSVGDHNCMSSVRKNGKPTDFLLPTLSPKALESDFLKISLPELEKQNLRLIPLIIKPCDLPEALKSKRAISFVDYHQFNSCLKELLAALRSPV